jgi:hypothetical protein
MPDAYVFEACGVASPRLEEGESRPDKAYGLWKPVSVMGLAMLLKEMRSVGGSDGEDPVEEAPADERAGTLVCSGEPSVLEPDEGAWVGPSVFAKEARKCIPAL